jgi:archaellum component FlaC
MTKSEYQELVEFIAPQFGRINERFDAVDARFDTMDERLRRVEVLGEDNRHQIQIVAESVTGVGQRLDAFRSEVAAQFTEVTAQFTEVGAEFADVRKLLRTSHRELDGRVTTLEDLPNT